MTKILTGKEVAYEIKENIKERVSKLVKSGVRPTLAILTYADNRQDSYAYERSLVKQANEIGIDVYPFEYRTEQRLIRLIEEVNDESWIHGCIIMRPLPEDIDESILNELDVRKDIDGITTESLANIFVNGSKGYAPATAEACIKLLDYYDIPIEGKDVVVVGRSLVVGKPLAMMLLNRNATVSICHSKSKNTKHFTANADIVICATGNPKEFDSYYFDTEGTLKHHTIIDVGINFDKDGKLCGDVDFDSVLTDMIDDYKSITPVPNGVGAVTTAVLLEHVVEAAEKAEQNEHQ